MIHPIYKYPKPMVTRPAPNWDRFHQRIKTAKCNFRTIGFHLAIKLKLPLSLITTKAHKNKYEEEVQSNCTPLSRTSRIRMHKQIDSDRKFSRN